MKISFISTVFNEEKTIKKFLESLNNQTRLPDEIIIVDGGSTDNTFSAISKFIFSIPKQKIKIIKKTGNRSVGRNEAIKQATGDVIVCSDAGNILDKNWIKNITQPFNNKNIDVVAGYYQSVAKNVFQQCVTPFVLVMPDKIDPTHFLPATRSVAFKKTIWKKVGKFDESLSHNEDYVFANKLRDNGAIIVFAKDAIVYWLPRNTYKEAFVMFFRFAFGDAEAKIMRSSVLLLFARYFLGLYLIFLSALYKSMFGFVVCFSFVILYFLWSIKKNYRYVKQKNAMVILPRLQIIADAAVLSGTILGLCKRLKRFHYLSLVKKHTFLFVLLLFYIGSLLVTLRWGIPNENHPFPYHMDEWHQLQAVRATFKYGTPNIEGSANGTMFGFLLSGFYLIPSTVLHYINPAVLKVNDLFMRERIFELLRINTIIWGTLTVIFFYKTLGLINASKKLGVFLFITTPIWLMLSGYFKYDIALLFWIILSIYFFFRFAKNPTPRNYLIAGIASGLAVAVKVSALPLLIIYTFLYFWFNWSFWKKDIKYLFSGIGIFIACILLFGMPDTLFGTGNIIKYLFENIIASPATSSNFQLGMNPFIYLFVHNYPLIFGHGLVLLFLISLFVWMCMLYKRGFKEQKIVLFLVFSLIVFILSLLPLQIWAVGNRSLVLLPFVLLFIGKVTKEISRNKMIKPWIVTMLIFICIIQLYESFAWFYMKVVTSPQQAASLWIEKNISQGKTIGIENIPIYQKLPEIVQKEFYFNQYHINYKNKYTYSVIDSKSKTFPAIMIITDDEIEKKVLKESPKKDLLKVLEQKRYTKIATFHPDFTYYKIFGTDVGYYLSGMVATPVTITVYKK